MSYLISSSSEEWVNQLRNRVENEAGRTSFVGVGNPIKSDDSVGLYIVSKLRKKYGAAPKRLIRIESPYIRAGRFSAIGKDRETVILVDAVESNSLPGSIIFANIEDSKYGFFVTHNIPLKLIPNIAKSMSKIFVLGIQPKNNEVGERLSDPVRSSADEIVQKLGEFIEGMKD